MNTETISKPKDVVKQKQIRPLLRADGISPTRFFSRPILGAQRCTPLRASQRRQADSSTQKRMLKTPVTLLPDLCRAYGVCLFLNTKGHLDALVC